MAIRFLLVSLVASLGFEPPSATDVAGWAKTGREWVLARIDDFKGAAIVAERNRADAEFDTVVAEMTDGFAADLVATERSNSKARLAFEPIAVPDELEAGIAFALNRDSQGVAQALAEADLPPRPYEFVGPPVEIVRAAPIAEPVRVNRLASAVRLTRQAALAWMTLLHDTDSTVVRR